MSKSTFMEAVMSSYKKVQKDLKTNPRKCEICGIVETMDNLILMYDNGKFMCDDCMLDFYKSEEFEKNV